MRIAVPLPGTMWAFDVISIIQIFDDDSVMYGSSDRPVIDFIANASSKALDHACPSPPPRCATTTRNLI